MISPNPPHRDHNTPPQRPANAESSIPNAASTALPAFLVQLLDPCTDIEDIARDLTTHPEQVAYWSDLPKMRDLLATLRGIWTLRADLLAIQARAADTLFRRVARLVYSAPLSRPSRRSTTI